MADRQITEFLALLRKSGLLTPQQLDAAQGMSTKTRPTAESSGSSTVESFAAELVKQEWLTQWQASQLLKGQTGFILQHYRLLAPVGKGGMGHVFKALDTKTGAIVAIKVMSRKLTGNQTLVNRFRREIRASSLLNNPHIVRTLDAGRVGNVDFMVMEYVNGDQVDRIVSRITAIPVAMACEIVRQVAIGLQHAHEQKMVHRDLKPGNLMVDWSADGSGTVKIMDMGLVRLGTDGEERTSVTKAGQVMGTPDYMSPEQGWDTATVDIRSDIYSLGCTFFRLLTGRVPFPGDNPLQVLMARCSKDAPSSKNLRPDIPDPVDAIVRRMTLRDPAARFQSPQEVIDILEPFSTPLTVNGLRSVLKESGEDDAIALELASVAENADPQDVGYQQFLREMDSGAAVDLMLSTNGGDGQAFSSTIPILPQTDRRVAGARRPAPANKTASTIALASASAGVALIVLFILLNRDSDGPEVKTVVPKTDSEISVPPLRLASATPVKVLVGDVLTFQPAFDGPAPVSPLVSKLRFRLGKGAPAGVQINAESGRVLWEVPREQAAADYEIPIEVLLSDAGKSQTVSEMTLVATVLAGMPRYSFANREPLMIVPGEAVQLQIAAGPTPDPKSGLEYRLGQGRQPAMQLDPTTGNFSWTPTDDDVGRKIISVQLYDPKDSSVLATGTIALLVRPVIRLPSFPEQTAVAGKEFRLQLLQRVPKFIGRAVQIVVKEGSPKGVAVDSRKGTLNWNVPEDAVGKYEIRLALESQLPNFDLGIDQGTETVIVVNITGTKPKSLIPPAAEVTAAEMELRDVFKREIAGAKSTTERASLAGQLLQKAEEQSQGATDYAMLNIIAELADKGKATDVGLEANHLRSIRYETPEIPVAKELAASFRANSISAGQADSVIENLLRLALLAANEKQFADVVALLAPPEQLLRKQDRASLGKLLADDIANCHELAEELSMDGPIAAADIKENELLRMLSRWQFHEIFSDVNTLNFISSDNTATDRGRSLWTIENNRIRMRAEQKKGVTVGLLDPTPEAARYLLRMQLSADTTAAMLVFGANNESNLNAHLLTLDRFDFGQINEIRGGNVTVSKAAASAPAPTAGWNNIEVLVDGPLVAVRLNGTPVVSTQVAALKPGLLGLLAPLELSPTPQLDLRRARILILPEPPGK